MHDPKGFLKIERQDSEYRPPENRLRDWREMTKPLKEIDLTAQGTRCMDCGVPFCQGSTGCPVENLIPEWNDLASAGRWQEALDRLHATNNFPEFTGRLCPAPCESACVLGIHNEPVAIRAIEWSLVDRGFEEGWIQPQPAARQTGHRVAVVGSGPAGLAAAQELARSGHHVTVFEKDDRVGGLLRYGIPDFKLEKWVLERRLDQLRAEGVEFKTGIAVGSDLAVDDLQSEFDAICLTLGAQRARDLAVPGRDLAGIHFAMDYLTQQNRLNDGEAVEERVRIDAAGKRVVVIGGGDTGSDCVGTALRQGAKEVLQLELMPRPPAMRSESTPWPLWPMRLRTSHAHEEGGQREWSLATTGFIGERGHVTHLRTERVEYREGRFLSVAGTEREIEADLVLLAMGFIGVSHQAWLRDLGVELSPSGAIPVNSNFMTQVPGIFAGGDAKRGASLIVWAISEGRKIAAGVNRFLSR